MLQEQGRMKSPSVDEKLAKEYNADFNCVAFAVNQILEKDANFRDIIHKEIGAMFDGDYNVLISQLIVKYNYVEDLFNSFEVEIRSIVEKYPLIQIAIPVEYEKWDKQKGLPVVFVSYEFDESETKFVNGYDLEGNNISLGTVEKPNFPVVVISENEETNVLNKLPAIPEPPKNLTATGNDEGIMLEWQQYSDEDLVGYDIYRKADSNENFVQIASLVSSKSENNTYSFLDENAFGKNYQYYVVSSSNHNTGDFIIVTGDLYTLRKNIGTLYSDLSNVVNDNGYSHDIDLKIFYHTPFSFKLEWDSPFNGPYQIYRYRFDDPNNPNIITMSSKSFVDANLSGRYKYVICLERDNTIRSNFAIACPSYRDRYQKIQLKDCKLYSEEALKEVESWTRGKPDMRVRCCISNGCCLVLNKLIKIPKPNSRKDSHEKWNPVNQEFLLNDGVNSLGSIVSFFWWEEDGGCKLNRSIEAEVYYENHYRARSPIGYAQFYNDFFAPRTEIMKLYKNDYLISAYNGSDNYAFCNQIRVFEWWHQNDENDIVGYIDRHPYIRVQWRIKTVN
ncbi:MAG: hypothetical protein LBS50_09875 [Prevotellaceae bacterium]|nr:hypothetical protein [Prevotellaceae bacterium]